LAPETGTLSYTAITGQTLSSYAISSSVTKPSVTFTITDSGIAGGSFPVTVAANGSAALPVGVTAGITNVAVPAVTTGHGTATFTVTATTPTAGTSYTVTHNSVTYTVTYVASTLTGGSITLTPANGTTAKTLIGGTATVSAKVVDQLGVAAPNALVVFRVTGRNTYSASVLTNASGVATYNIVDTGTASTTATTDTIYADAFNAGASSATLTSSSSALTYVSSLAATTVTLSNNGATTSPYTALDGSVTATVKAVDAYSVLSISGLPVTFSLGSGVYTAGSLAGYTDANGSATLAVAGSITGSNTVSVSVGGKTASTSFTVANVAANDVHTVSKQRSCFTRRRKNSSGCCYRGRIVTATSFHLQTSVLPMQVQLVVFRLLAELSEALGKTGTDGTVNIDLSATSNESGSAPLR
jgi:hypothetical protein